MEDSSAIGRVIMAARDIEGQLVRLGASGKGMRERLASVEHGLPASVVAKIRRIGEQRNRLAHETGATLEPSELQALLTDCQNVLAYLSALEGLPARPDERAALLQKATGQVELSPDEYYKRARGESYQLVAAERVPELLQKATGQTQLSVEEYYRQARSRNGAQLIAPDELSDGIFD